MGQIRDKIRDNVLKSKETVLNSVKDITVEAGFKNVRGDEEARVVRKNIVTDIPKVVERKDILLPIDGIGDRPVPLINDTRQKTGFRFGRKVGGRLDKKATKAIGGAVYILILKVGIVGIG